MELALLGSFIGGIGLFLLGMKLMTKGLMLAAGKSLKRILDQATRSPLRGLLSGTAVTALVQSSSAVTVALLGLVNAGLLSLGQAMPVIFGSNIGTTFTGWLVATLGVKLDIGLFALPMVGIGMMMRMSFGETARGRIGEAIAGFGLFFVGVDVLKENFTSLGQQFDLGQFGGGARGLVMHFLIGTLLTFLMQSSSASMALTLTAVAGGAIQLEMACAMVIGANVGTTTTAILAALGGRVNAKRVAGGHVLFNLITGIAGLILLPVVIWALRRFEYDQDPALILAMFHTAFNVFGVLLLWHWIRPMERFLCRMFREPQQAELALHLDRSALQMPTLGIMAISRELQRSDMMARTLARAAISAEFEASAAEPERIRLQALLRAINSYAAELQKGEMNQQAQAAMPFALLATGYQQQLAELLAEFRPGQQALDEALQAKVDLYREAVLQLVEMADGSRDDYHTSEMKRARKQLQHDYKDIKKQVLQATALQQVDLGPVLDFIESLREMARMTELAEKGARNLYRLRQSTEPEAQKTEPGQEAQQTEAGQADGQVSLASSGSGR